MENSSARTSTSTTTTNNDNHDNDNNNSNSNSNDNNNNTASALIIAAAPKAGIPIDRTQIDQIILRESGNSLYMQQQRKRDNKVNQRIVEMKSKLSLLQQQQQQQEKKYNSTWKLEYEKEMEHDVQTILSNRDKISTKVVVDLDQFFIACELLTKPELKQKPCCVGHGLISTSNYVARRYGVRSAMAGYIADKLVSELSNGKERLIHLSSNFDLYRNKSQIVYTVLKEYDPSTCNMMSLDECKLNIGPYLLLKLYCKYNHNRKEGGAEQGEEEWNHEQIRDCLLRYYNKQTTSENQKQQHVEEGEGDVNDENKEENDESNYITAMLDDYETILFQSFSQSTCLSEASNILSSIRQHVSKATSGLTCSIGLANNFTLAKIASDINKPNGQLLIGSNLEQHVLPFIRPLSIRKVPGIGRVTQKLLQAFSINTVQDLYNERALVKLLFPTKTAKFLLRASMGGYGSSNSSETTGEEDDDDENNNNNNSSSSSSSTLDRKGISRERTFSPEQSWNELNMKLEDLAWKLSNDMKEKKVWARTISLKIKLKSFDVFQKSRTIRNGDDDGVVVLQGGDELLRHASELLRDIRRQHTEKNNNSNKKGNPFSLRLIGIRCSNLVDEQMKASIAASKPKNQLKMEHFLSDEAQQQLKSPNGISSSSVSTNRNPQTHQKTVGTSSRKEGLYAYFSKSGVDKKNSKSKIITERKESAKHKGETSTQWCPICGQKLPKENDAVNRHIDSCLNAPLIPQAIQEESNNKDLPLPDRKMSDAPEQSRKRKLVIESTLDK